MRKDDWTGLGVSLAVHLLLLFVVGVAVAAAKKPAPEIRLVQLEFGPLDAPASAARPSAYAPEPNPQPPRPEPRPEQTRPTPPATTPVRPPRTQTAPPRENPLPRPETQEDSRPQPPAPPEPQPSDPTSGGTPTGQQGTTSNPESGSGASDSGSEGVSFSLGNRSFDCPATRTQRFTGGAARVTYRITFDPAGRYVTASPVTRAGITGVDDFMRNRILPTCRAQPLPPGASRMNQSVNATFNIGG